MARVAREQRALDRLGQVDEREDRGVEARDVGCEPRLLGRGEGLGGEVHQGGHRIAPTGANGSAARGARVTRRRARIALLLGARVRGVAIALLALARPLGWVGAGLLLLGVAALGDVGPARVLFGFHVTGAT